MAASKRLARGYFDCKEELDTYQVQLSEVEFYTVLWYLQFYLGIIRSKYRPFRCLLSALLSEPRYSKGVPGP